MMGLLATGYSSTCAACFVAENSPVFEGSNSESKVCQCLCSQCSGHCQRDCSGGMLISNYAVIMNGFSW